MRYLLCAIVAFVVACSSAPESTPVVDAGADAPVTVDAPEVVALTTPYRFQFEVVGNNFTSITPPAGTFCHPVALACSGAHSQAQTGYGGYPKFGGYIDGSDSTPMAYPNFPISPVTGYCGESLLCESFDWFGGSGAFKSGESDSALTLSWAQSPSTSVASSKVLAAWDFNSACWIDTLGSLSGAGERVQLDASGWNWRLNASGVSSLTGKAQCAYLGKPLVPIWLHLVAGQDPVWPEMTFAQGTCFIHNVKGNLDDGSVILRHDNPNGAWKFEIGGGIELAEAYCVRF